MQYKTLGDTGLLVSTICFGTMTFHGGSGMFRMIGSVDQSGADELIKSCIEAGINFYDTADVYSEGESEKTLAASLRNLNIARKDVVIATKVFGRVGPGRNDVGASRGHIMDAVDASLKRLQTDYIDLYQVHGTDIVTPLEETLRALDTLVSSGKVRYIGVSNWHAWRIAKALGRRTTPSPGATSSARSCRCSNPKRPACWSGVRSRAVCCPENSAAKIRSLRTRAAPSSTSPSSTRNAPGKFLT
jgi:aryl-alcohol dehydrogenase-like predicted oxidoreductase